MIDVLRDSLTAQQEILTAAQEIKFAVGICACLLAGNLIATLSTLIVRALRRKRPRIHDDTPRPRPLPTPPRYPVSPRYVAASDFPEPPTRKTHKRTTRKRNKPPSGRKARYD